MKNLISIIVALVLVLGLSSAVVFADVVKPTASYSVASLTGISSVTVEGTVAAYWRDSNTASAKYIRAELPVGTSGKTEYDLSHATVVITTAGDVPSITGYTGSLTGTNEYTFSGVNLFNNAYSVTVGSNSYTLAAGLADGRVNISASDPLKLSGYLNDSSNTIDAFGSCQNNPYMGNPYYSTGWTFISYFFAATLPENSNTGNVSGSLTVDNNATLSVDYATGTSNYNFSSGHNATVTSGGVSRVYYPRLSVTNGTITISRSNYDFNFTELKGDTTYYTSTIADRVEEIEKAWSAFLEDSTATTFASGSTAMDVVTRFITWSTSHYVEGTTPYFTGTSDTASGTYLSRLDGLDASDCGYMAGYMYAIEPYEWNSVDDHSAMGTVGADGYTLSDSTYVVWFYTTNFMRWFNW